MIEETLIKEMKKAISKIEEIDQTSKIEMEIEIIISKTKIIILEITKIDQTLIIEKEDHQMTEEQIEILKT